MRRIRHAALCVSDIARSARFYSSVLDFVEVERGTTPRADYCYLVDGECHLALLHYASDEMAGVADSSKFIGAHHFGIQVEDLARAQAESEAAGARFHFNLGDEQQGNFESKYRDPNRAIFDLSYGGWGGTPTQRLGSRPGNVPPPGRAGAASLRHVAVAVGEPAKSAAFFMQVFGFRRVGHEATQGAGRIDLSDGHVELAFIRSPGGEAVLGLNRGADFTGTHHVGFSVSDTASFEAKLLEGGGQVLDRSPDAGAFAERRYADPDGIVFVASENAWSAAARSGRD